MAFVPFTGELDSSEKQSSQFVPFTGELDPLEKQSSQFVPFTGKLDLAAESERFTPYEEPYEVKTANPFKGLIGRAAELTGSGIEAVAEVGERLGDKLELAMPLSNLTPEQVKNEQQLKPLFDWARSLKDWGKDIGYSPSTKLGDLADNPLTTIPFIAERVITSVPDMAASVINLPAYVSARTKEILDERVKNDDKTLDDATVEDVTAAATAAVIEGTFERFATKRLGLGEVPAGASKIGRVTREGAVQSGTEFVEEVGAYTGETAGTKRGFDVEEAALAGLEGAIVGGGLGATVQSVKEVLPKGPRTVEDEQIDALQKMQTDDMGEVVPPETKIGTDTTQIGDDTGRSEPSVSVSPGVDEAPTGTSGVDIGRVDSPIEDVDGTAVRATEVDTTLKTEGAPVGFKTEKGSIYSLDEQGRTSRTKVSEGKGKGTTYDPHAALYVKPEDAQNILSDMQSGAMDDSASVRLGYIDIENNVFKTVTDTSQIPAGTEAVVGVVDRNKNQLIGSYKAQLTPAVGLSPVEKMYTPDGMSNTHIGNKIVELFGQATPAAAPAATPEVTPAATSTPEQKGQASLSITPSGTLTLPDLMRQEDPKLQEKFEEIRTGKKKVFKTYAPVVEDMQRTVDQLSEFIRQQGVDPTNLASLRSATPEVQNAATLLSALGQDANNLTLAVKNQEINYARAKTPEAKAEVTDAVPQRKLAEAQNTIRVAREFIADPSKGMQDVMAFPRYRLATEGTEGMPVAKVEKLVQRMTAKWKNAPDIFVVQSTVDLEQYGLENINPRARGVFEPGTQSVFLIADNITDYTDAVITVAHESIGHFGLQSVLGGSYKKTMNRLYETNAEVRKLADVKMANEGLSKEVAVEEVLAEAVEQKVAPQSALGRALTTLRNVLRNFFRLLGVESSNSEIDSLITRAANYVIAGTVQVEKNVTKTDAFKNWFGDSVIRNLDGTPKIMYHGTAADFSLFKLKQANAIFVTADPEFADEFTLRSEEHMKTLAAKEKTTYTGGRNIMPLYVRAEKPFDYENREHVKEVLQIIKQNDPDYYTDFDLTVLGETIRNGSWQNIETTAVRRALDELGFDSFYVEENNRKNLAVFDPNQVKSATGNAGSFSRDSKDILLAKKATALTSGAKQIQTVFYSFKPEAGPNLQNPGKAPSKLQQLSGNRPVWDKVKGAFNLKSIGSLPPTAKQGMYKIMTLRMLKDLAGNRLPQMARAITVSEQMVAERSRIMRDGADILDKVQDLRKEKNGEKQVKLLGELTVQATMLEIDPDPKSKFHKPNKTLTDAWNTLTPKAQEIYREMRTFYENQIDGMVQDMLARVDRNITDPTKRTQMRKDIMDEFGPAKRKGPYFPLRRFGQYWFQVGKGADKEFYMFESVGDRDFWMAERQKELVAAKRQDLADSMASGDSLREGANSLNSALASEPIMQKVEKMIDDAALNLADPIKQARAVDELKDGIKQLQYLLLPSTNLRKAFIHRKGIAGASPDLVRVFSTSAVNLAYQRARVKYSEQFYNNIENGFAFLEGAPNNEDTRTMRDLLNELDSRASHVVGLEPTGALEKVSNGVTQFTFLWLLTAPASAMVNVFGAAAVAMPYIGARYGYDKAMGKISSYAAKYVATAPKVKEKNTFFPTLDKSTTLDPIQAAAYQQFLHDNTIDVSLTQDIMGLGQAPFEDYSLSKNKLIRGVSALFHHSERMSREIMNMAAFDLAYADNVEKGMAPGIGEQAFKEAIETAKDLTMMSIGDFTRASKPPILTGPVTRIVFQFKQYSLLMTYNLLRNTMIGFNPLRENITDEQKAEAREARRRMYGVMGVTALFAGLKGMPIFTATGMIAEVLNSIFGDDEEEEFVFEYWLQNELTETVGGDVAASLMTGLIANATNTALSERMSLDLVDLWFRDGTYQKSAEDTMREQFIALLGPSASIVLSFGRALDLHDNYQLDRALETISPTILRNLQIVGRYAREGEAATARGITIDDDISYSDLFVRALGFTPEDIMRKQKAIIDRKGVQNKIEARRERLLAGIYLANYTGDTDLQERVIEKIIEYNESFPEFPITIETIEQSLNRKLDDKAKQEALGGVSEKLYGRIEAAIPTRD
jgi:hypothetical protein